MQTVASVRATQPQDAQELLALMREKAVQDGISAEMAANELTLRSIPDKVVVLVAVAADESIIGYVTYTFVWSLYAARDFVWLDDLYVRASSRRTGAAMKLIRAMCRHARRVGACRIDWIYSNTNSAAAGLYRALGAVVHEEYKFARLDEFTAGAIADSDA